MAAEQVTGKYDMGGADVGGAAGSQLAGTSGGGLVDVSAAAPGHSAVASPEMQRAVQVGSTGRPCGAEGSSRRGMESTIGGSVRQGWF